jgi:hypothetical protein
MHTRTARWGFGISTPWPCWRAWNRRAWRFVWKAIETRLKQYSKNL